MAAVVSEKVTEPPVSPPQSIDRSSSRRVSDAAGSDLSAGEVTYSADSPDRRSSLDHSLSTSVQLDYQYTLSLRSEEYRQLFRLTPDEVLIQDFNCALQENFLLQGHMYLFSHYICFYSNLFGFETKKIIPFHEVTSVRRAKAAAIFPTAIEILAGGKKYFFTSFLSRDEAFTLINDGWELQSNGAKSITDQQESKSDLQSQENESASVAESSAELVGDPDSIERDKDSSTPDDLAIPVEGHAEKLPTSTRLQDNVEEYVEIVQSIDCSPSGTSLIWEEEDCDAPGVPECFMLVAESKFLVRVDEFFYFFFSDDAVGFQESFHRKCGDKDFRCTKWCRQENFGYTRDVSFQHPIKIYLGAKFGSCREVQTYRVYRNSHLVVDTSQDIANVPYGDYFSVEGLWHVERDGDESKTVCRLRVYVNVNFSKKTMFKGKIMQSTVDECRDAYAEWIDLAHKLLKEKNLEVQENEAGGGHASTLTPNNEICLQKQEREVVHPEQCPVPQTLPNTEGVNQHITDSWERRYNDATSMASSFRDLLLKFCSSLKNQSHISLLLIISIAVILILMQMTILMLLSRPQQIHVIPQADWAYNIGKGASDRANENALVDKQIKNLKEELRIFEMMLDKMQHEQALLKVKLKELELLQKQ